MPTVLEKLRPYWVDEAKYQKALLVVAGAFVTLCLLYTAVMVVTDPRNNLIVVDPHFVLEDEMIVGTVENRTGRIYSNVAVNVDFYDADDNLVATAATVAGFLEGGERWEFKVPVTSKEAVRFETAVSSPDNFRARWLGGSVAY